MAMGLEMLDALKRATADLPMGSRFEINAFDAKDLMKLTEHDLRTRGFDPIVAERVDRDLSSGNLAELGKAIGIDISVDRAAGNLIPGEGLRRSRGILASDVQPLETLFEELDRIRHPERYSA
jgi:hypothetical protein